MVVLSVETHCLQRPPPTPVLAAFSASHSPESSPTVGDYEIVEEIPHGGMALDRLDDFNRNLKDQLVAGIVLPKTNLKKWKSPELDDSS
jgi:hypothetical protein